MSASTISPASASEDWQIAEDGYKPASLIVQLQRTVHVFPWMRFVYAEGNNNLVKVAFASHLVTINGHGLAALLTAVAGQRVVKVMQPSEHEAQFGVRGPRAGKYTGAAIQSMTVQEFK
jgi:hypothetical protein